MTGAVEEAITELIARLHAEARYALQRSTALDKVEPYHSQYMLGKADGFSRVIDMIREAGL